MQSAAVHCGAGPGRSSSWCALSELAVATLRIPACELAQLDAKVLLQRERAVAIQCAQALTQSPRLRARLPTRWCAQLLGALPGQLCWLPLLVIFVHGKLTG